MLRIAKLKIENVKGIELVEIEPQGNLIRLTGANGAGKSSIIDAIFYLLGGKSALPTKPIRKGQEKASIQARLTGGEDITVTRTFTSKDSYLTVENKDGKVKSAQGLLDGLLGTFTLDPLAFSRMSPKDQYTQLMAMTVNTEALDLEEKTAFEERTIVGREVKRLEALVASMPVVALAETRSLDVLMDEMSKAAEFNQAIDKRQQGRDQVANKVREMETRRGVIERSIDALRKQISTLEEEMNFNLDECNKESARLAAAPVLPPKIDIANLRAEIEDARGSEDAKRAMDTRKDLAAQLQAKSFEYGALSATINNAQAKRKKLLDDAILPAKGLSLGEGELLYNGTPFSQINHADRIIVSAEMAMAEKPELRILRIDDGESLDASSRERLEALAAERDYQIWMAEVNEGGNVGIVIKEGKVADAVYA